MKSRLIGGPLDGSVVDVEVNEEFLRLPLDLCTEAGGFVAREKSKRFTTYVRSGVDFAGGEGLYVWLHESVDPEAFWGVGSEG